MLFRWIILLNFFGLVSFSLGQPLQGFREIQTAINALETASGNYSTIVSLLQNSTYSSALNLTDGSNKTILAPSDSAFDALSVNVNLDSLLANEETVIEILSYHVIPLYLPSTAIVTVLSTTNSTSVQTLEGSDLDVSLSGSSIFINEALVVEPDIFASGLTAVHGINEVLIPASNVTVPSQSPFASPPSPSLQPGSTPQNGTEELQLAVSKLSSANGNYSTLLSLLENSTYSASLNLTDGSNKTIFAPTNQAFSSLPTTYSSQLSNSSTVIEILSYHIVPLYLPSSSVLSILSTSNNFTIVSTLLGQSLNVSLNSTLKVNNSTVVEPDILASGITTIHGIDSVLVPNLSSGSLSSSSAISSGKVSFSALFFSILAIVVLV